MRTAEVARETKETTVRLTINIDGTGDHDIDTGVGFFDHMLSHIAKHRQHFRPTPGVGARPAALCARRLSGEGRDPY